MDRQYTEKFVAFIDILGFKELLWSEGGDATRISGLFDTIVNCNNILARINRFTSEKNPCRTIQEVYSKGKTDTELAQCYDAALADMTVKIVSDSIILAIPTRDDFAFTAIVDACSYIAQTLIHYERGFFVRGAITKGKVYFDEESVFFGEAYVRAFNLEETCCIFPRIIYENDSTKFSYANSFGRNETRISEDGWGGIDYIGNYLGIRDDCCLKDREVRIRNIINREIEKNSSKPEVCAKYHWVKTQVNRVHQLIMDRKRIIQSTDIVSANYSSESE